MRTRSDPGAAPPALRSALAPNASPLTLTGTRTYIVGRRKVAVIDAGPALPAHLDAVADLVGRGVDAEVLVTHGHPDHAGGAAALAERLHAPLRAADAGSLADGDAVETDAGELIAVRTPGHTPDHVAFHWPAAGAVFCGDLMMGGQETALVAAPEGDLSEYLASLERVRSLAPRVIYPAHGAPFPDPAAALDAYVRHRTERERQVLDALAAGPATVDGLLDAVYGTELSPRLRQAAGAALVAYLEHLALAGRVRKGAGARWRTSAARAGPNRRDDTG